MAYRAVDLDLFVNSFSKGVADGAKTPSPFSAFSNAMISGFDAEEKAEAVRQQNEIRQNQIDMLPVENRIREAQADSADAQLAGYRADPEAYTDLKKQQVENDLAKERREALMLQKRAQFDQIMQGPDGLAKGEAINSGEYDEVLTPEQKKQAIDQSYTDWSKADQNIYQEKEFQARQREALGPAEVKMAQEYTKFETDFLNNQELSALMKKAGEGTPINPSQMVEKGTIEKVERIKSYATDETTGELLVGPNGELIKSNKLPPGKSTPDKADIEEVYIFKYNGKYIGDVSSTEAVKSFNNYSSAYDYRFKRNKGQDGTTDLEDRAKQADARKAAIQAEEQAKQSEKAATVQEQRNAFFSSASINPQYAEAAKRVQAGITPKAETMAPEVKGTPSEPFAGQEYTAPDGSTRRVLTVPTGYAASISKNAGVTQDYTPNLTQQQQVISDPNAPGDRFGGSARANKVAQMQAYKVQEKLKSLEGPQAQTPAPVEQAEQVVAPSFVPPKMDVKTPYDPKTIAIQRVASRPETVGLSALTKSLIAQESGGVADAVSPTGVSGLAQLTSGTANEISSDIDRTDPVQSALGGAIYLEKLMATPAFNNNPMLALTAYNGGPGVTAKAISLAKSTNWNEVRKFIPRAVRSYDSYWKSIGVDTEQKVKETQEYAERVVANFPAFVQSRDDMEIANRLKQQGVLLF